MLIESIFCIDFDIEIKILDVTYGKFIIYYKKDKLSTLKEVNVINSFIELIKDIPTF